MTSPAGTQESIFAALGAEDQRGNEIRSRATQQYADRLAELQRLYPDLPAGVKISAARGFLSDAQISAIAQRTALTNANPSSNPQTGMLGPEAPQVVAPKKKDHSLWGRFKEKLATASRWSYAAMQFPVEMVQGGIAQMFDNNSDVSGWFISTNLGSMIEDSKSSGSGFFMSKQFEAKQGERARRYRGSVDGHAFTLGRGLAHMFFDPDTVPYRMLSGFVDAGVSLGVPFDMGMGDALQAARIAEEAGIGGAAVSTIAKASRTFGEGAKDIQATKMTAQEIEAFRQAAGALPSGAVDYAQANRFFASNFARLQIERTAKTTDFLSTWELFNRQIDPELALELTKADTPNAVRNVLLDKLGQAEGLRSMNDMKGGTRFGMMRLAARDKILADAQSMTGRAGRYIERGAEFMPKSNVNLLQAESPRDMISAIETIDRATRLFLTSPETRRNLLNEAADLIVEKNPVKVKAFYDKLDETFKASLVESGTSQELATALFGKHKQWMDNMFKYAVDDTGQFTDSGFYHRVLTGKAPARLEDAESVLIGPQTTADLLRNEYFIPNPREVRRASNKLNWLWVKKDPNLDSLRAAGQLRLPLAAAEYFQERVWRGIVTATVGNFVRNVVDSSVSLAMSDKPGVLGITNHPFQWMAFSANKRGIGDIFGREIDDAVRANMISDAQEAYRYATREQVGAYYKDYMEPYRRTKRLGVHNQYTRNVNADTATVARAHGDELGKLNADWAARSIANGQTSADLFAAIKAGEPEAKKWFETMRSLYENGQPVYNKATGARTWVSIDLTDDANLRHLLDSSVDRVNRITGQHPDLMRVVGQGKTPETLIEPNLITGKVAPGRRVEFKYTDKEKATHMGTVVSQDPATGQWIISPDAFARGENTDTLRGLLQQDDIFFDKRMPQTVVGEVRAPNTAEANKLMATMDHMISKFHQTLYEKNAATLERSPLFRNLYYEQIDRLASSLDHGSIKQILADVERRALELKMLPENYIRPELYKKLKFLDANPDKLYGTITREELNAFASGAALDDMKKMLYDATDRRNAVDVMRILSPFAQQQMEFLQRMGRMAFTPTSVPGLRLPNLRNVRRAQLLVKGGTQFDPEGDGRGFFFVDPTTNQWSFSFPLSGELTKLVTAGLGGGGGITAPIIAPVKGIALGLDYRPGFGPFATVAMSHFLPDTPRFDMIRNFAMPYGEKENLVSAVVPSWVQKVYDGIKGAKGARFFASTYAETVQALASTGDYNLSDPNERQRMLNDARKKSQALVILRGITQFTGPASGNYDMKVLTKEGDVYTSLLADSLQQFRNEDYNTATLKFIQIFGEDAFTYLSNKTKSLYGGLEASQEFGKFERSNPSFFAKYKDVAGFFGPVGTEFDFEVYTRQLRTGKRKRLTAEEMLSAAERVIGQAYYNAVKNQMGDKITGSEREYLSNYRAALVKQYPGFGQVDYNPMDTKTKIDQLFVAAKDIKNNPVADAVNYYEQIRAQAIAEADRRGKGGIGAASNQDLQEWVDTYAQALIAKYPEFGRVYDRLLSRELNL